jgi:hypothetical protein
LSQALLAMLALLPSACLAAAGDVAFRAADKTIHLNPANLATAMDVFFEVDGLSNMPATGWGMIVNIAPQAGATGTVQFNPPTIVNNAPNLMPSSQNPFVDFDRDFGGKSYGMLGDSATQLHAFSYYVAPTMGPAPSLDANGNLTLPDGSGLVSLPLITSADASGDFSVTFDPDIVVTGAVFATGMPAPDDVGIHPAGTHIAGILSVINPAGDYNRNRVVDAADYVVWRNTMGQSGPGLAADGNDNNQVDVGDYNVWRAHFGQTAASGTVLGSSTTAAVPEPTASVMLLTGILATCCRRRVVVSLSRTCRNTTRLVTARGALQNSDD